MTNNQAAKSPYDEQYILCPHCDLLVELPRIAKNHKAICPRCHCNLARSYQASNLSALIYAVCALVMLLFASGFWLLNISVMGSVNYLNLKMIPSALLDDHYVLLAINFVLFVIICPLFALLNLILITCRISLSNRFRRWLLLIFARCQHWAMAEIFLAGILVSFVKLVSYGDIGINTGFIPYCFFIVFYLKAISLFDVHLEWQQLGPTIHVLTPMVAGKTGIVQNIRLCRHCAAILPFNLVSCPRCNRSGKVRDLSGIQWSLAFLLSAILLYVPANLFAIMTMTVLGSSDASTIMDGVLYMWQSGDYPIALIIFTASITIPVLKILALILLNYFALKPAQRRQQDCQRMHKLYQAVELIGRWSMIDVFVVSVIVTLFHHGHLMRVAPAIGASCFALVVVMTMIASYRYDPRLIWDRSV